MLLAWVVAVLPAHDGQPAAEALRQKQSALPHAPAPLRKQAKTSPARIDDSDSTPPSLFQEGFAAGKAPSRKKDPVLPLASDAAISPVIRPLFSPEAFPENATALEFRQAGRLIDAYGQEVLLEDAVLEQGNAELTLSVLLSPAETATPMEETSAATPQPSFAGKPASAARLLNSASGSPRGFSHEDEVFRARWGWNAHASATRAAFEAAYSSAP